MLYSLVGSWVPMFQKNHNGSNGFIWTIGIYPPNHAASHTRGLSC